MKEELVYVSAAVSPLLGRMTTLRLPDVNTDMMNIFLGQVAIAFSQYVVILLVEIAGWHLSGELSFPDKVRFIPQPAFTPRNASPMEAFLGVSPFLNPTEHLWDDAGAQL